MISQPYFTLLFGLFALSLWPRSRNWLSGQASTSFQDLPFVLSLSLGSMLVGEALRWPDLLLHINGGLWVMSLGLHLLSRDRNSVPEKVSRLLMTSALVLAAIGSMGFFRALN